MIPKTTALTFFFVFFASAEFDAGLEFGLFSGKAGVF